MPPPAATSAALFHDPFGPAAESIWRRCAEAVRGMPPMHPAEFAEKFRVLHERYCVEHPGPWRNAHFPYQAQVMNMGEEAIRSGKRGFVLMKSGQSGGTDCMGNLMLWLKVYFPGPQLFLTATEDVADEFGRNRFELVIRDCEPLKATFVPNSRGDHSTKRFTDGDIKLAGGKSVNNLQSLPYRHVVLDELDSLAANLGGQGDPLRLAENRTDSFGRETLLIAYAHPSTRDRGAAKLFYEESDQRRGFVKHGSCAAWFWLQWEHVRCNGDDKNADNYCYACPNCGEVIEDPERVAMVRQMEYRSVLPPEEAPKKRWIGAHVSLLYSPWITLKKLVERWISCGTDENSRRVFYNKTLGEPYEPLVKSIAEAELRRLIVVKRRQDDPEFYSRGQVPPGVRFLTAGQDSNTTRFNFAVWGWGLRRSLDGNRHLCGWLIDWGEIERPRSLSFSESEYHVFDDLIYRRSFPSALGEAGKAMNVMQAGHDIGYAPTQIPIITYCRSWPNRAVPVKGAALTMTSASLAPYARWGSARKYKAGEVETVDDASKHLQLNTYMLKSELYGMMEPDRTIEIHDRVNGQNIGTRKVPRVMLPENVEDEWITQSANEGLGKGKKLGETVWLKTGPNHFADCNTYALGCALNLDPYQQGMTADEYAARKKYIRRGGSSSGGSGGPGRDRDPAMW